MTAADPDTAGPPCPVCGQAASEQPQCPACGWTLLTPWRAGRLDHAARAEFQARLSAACLAYDARIVARIAAPQPEPYASCIRGGPPTAGQWAAARRAAAADATGAGDDDTLRARLRALLVGLTADTGAVVAEVGPHGIAVLRLRLDEHGSPAVVEDGTTDWAALMPGLPAAGPERHLRLAADARLTGADGQPGDPLALVARPDTGPGGQPVVICRPAGWAALERAAGLLAARSGETPLRITAGPDAEPVLAVLAELAAAAPLTRAYHVLVADVDGGSGTVRTHARQLFARGDLPGAHASLTLRRLPGDYTATNLAIFAGGAAEPMALYSAPLPASPTFQLDVSLVGPGRIGIAQPEATAENRASWRRIRASVPDRVDVTTAPADLVCAVDLTGTEDVVQARRQLVTGLLKQLAVEYPEPGRLRTAVLTCRDHDYGPNEKDDVVSGCGLRPAGEAADWLAVQPAEEPRYVGAAPVEDLLARAYQQLRASNGQGRAARVLTVTGKQPHPARMNPYAPRDIQRLHPCPHGADWHLCLVQLTTEAAARCVTVTDALTAVQVVPPVWRQLGPHGLHALAAATPRRLGEDLGLLVRPEQLIPVPIPDWK